MRWSHFLARSAIIFSLALLLASAVALLSARPAYASAHDDCSSPTPGKHIYDCAGVLGPTDLANLEADAKAVDQAGAPAVVYLQVKYATVRETRQDASDLMQRWHVESSPGAQDGFVMFFNLSPENIYRHGTVVIYPGPASAGTLSQRGWDQTVSDEVYPELEAGDIATAIAVGLDAVVHDLRHDQTNPSLVQSAKALILPANIFALCFTCCTLLLIVYTAIGHFSRKAPTGARATIPPDDLPPALAGALVRGRVRRVLLQATILDLACREALSIEPIGEKWIALRLINEKKTQPGYEHHLWKVLKGAATPERYVDIIQARSRSYSWFGTAELLHQELLRRGWYASSSRSWCRAFAALAVLALVLAFFDALATLRAWDTWQAPIGFGLFLLTALASFLWWYYLPETTAQGEREAARWRGYLAGLNAANHQPQHEIDLDLATPYALALGARRFLKRRLRQAEQQGYIPGWLGPLDEQQRQQPGFYRYWRTFYRTMRPYIAYPAQPRPTGLEVFYRRRE